MSKHDRHHDHCEHALALCDKCDMAYCTKCSKEWGAECKLTHWPYYVYSGGVTTYPGTTAVKEETTCGGNPVSHASHAGWEE